MIPAFSQRRTSSTTPITLVTNKAYTAWVRKQGAAIRGGLRAAGFVAKPGAHIVLPSVKGQKRAVLAVIDEAPDLWAIADLPNKLPTGTYALDEALEPSVATVLAVGWGLGGYRFDRYLSDPRPDPAKLVIPKSVDRVALGAQVEATFLARDLINTPAADMGPPELAAAAKKMADRFGAKTRVVRGKVLEDQFPAVHAVGRAADKAPRLIDFTWGKAQHPKVTLVGKGVCFDTGGLNLKPAQGMRWMKKDMGGAAVSLGLAHLIMSARLPVRLRVIIPAVENNVAGNAFRPGDVLATRKGVSIEIGNTDAEGRLVLADGLALADEESPDLLIDCATLTGAARVALGADLPAMFCDDDGFAEALASASEAVNDPLWRLPLWQPYRRLLNTPIADINNAGTGGLAGAITAALFLATFVENAKTWAHLDLYGWNDTDRPGRPQGGEAMAMRALFEAIRQRFAVS
jgi:leucyl aminopeptidase